MSISKIREKNLFKNIKDEAQIAKIFDEKNEQHERNFKQEPPIEKAVSITLDGGENERKDILIKK